jgi:hypothetical protein
MASLLKNILTTQWETHHFVKYSARGIHKWIYVHLNKKESYLELHCFVPSTKKSCIQFLPSFPTPRNIHNHAISDGERGRNTIQYFILN